MKIWKVKFQKILYQTRFYLVWEEPKLPLSELFSIFFAVVQSLSRVQLFATTWTAARQASPSFTISWSLLKLMSIESVILSNHLILCHPLLLCPQSFPASGSFPMSGLFALGSQSIGASASVLPMNIQGWFPLGLTGLISLQSKGLKSLLQHHGSKASILWCSAFFMVQQTETIEVNFNTTFYLILYI